MNNIVLKTGSSKCCDQQGRYEQKFYTFKWSATFKSCGNKLILSEAEAGLLNSPGASAVVPVNCGHRNCKGVINREKQPVPVLDR